MTSIASLVLGASVIASLAACHAAGGAPTTPTTPTATTTTSTTTAAQARSIGQIQWRGGPTVILTRGDMRILTDPMLGPRGPAAFISPKHPSTGLENVPVARYTDPPADPIGRLDLIILSHNHTDHFDDTAKRQLPKDVLFIAPPSAVAAVRSYGFTNVRALDWGEETTVETTGAKVKIRALPAHHAHDAELDARLGKGNGYVFEWSAPTPYSIYWTGDTIVTEDLKAALRGIAGVDLWLPHMGGVGSDGTSLRTLDATEALEAAAVLRPRHILPIHHTTFGHYREPVTALVQRVRAQAFPATIAVLEDGVTTELPTP